MGNRVKSGSPVRGGAPIVETADSEPLDPSPPSMAGKVPGYSSKQMKFGAYLEDNFSVLFIDVRQSTGRAERIGPEDTFLTFHAFIPGVTYTVESYGGKVMDFMGDGIMAFFGGKKSGVAKSWAGGQAGKCGLELLKVLQIAINPVLMAAGIEEVRCGVGVTHGRVIVTKIGTRSTYDVKAFGECVNKASKLCGGDSELVVDRQIRDWWPSSKGGRTRFVSATRNGESGFVVLSET